MNGISSFCLTGATGFIGFAVVKELVRRGYKVTAIVRRGSTRAEKLKNIVGVKIVEGNLGEPVAAEKIGGADAFIHLGWEKTSHEARDDFSAQEKNVAYSRAAAELAAKIGAKVFVGAGSQAEYGVKDSALTPDTPCAPESAYGKAKLAAAIATSDTAQKFGMRWSWARILSVYGEGDTEGSFISYLIKCFLSGITPSVTPCEQVWDYLYVDDCARALADIAERGADKRAYPVGSGKTATLKEFALMVRDAASPNAEIGFGEKPYYPHQPMFLAADISALTRDTGFVPETDFREGILKTVQAAKAKL